MLSVIVPAWGGAGNPYARFVTRWWAAVGAMVPAPAEVVVVHTYPEPLGIIAAAPPGIAVKSVPIKPTRPNEFANAGIEAASHPWVSVIGVDDFYRPDALAGLAEADACGADIMVWDQEELGSHVWGCYWCPATLRQANTLAGSCPVRRILWARVGGFPDLGWSDWAFWLKAAAVGAKAWHCGRVGVVFDPGRDHETFSGVQLPSAVRLARDAEIMEFARNLPR